MYINGTIHPYHQIVKTKVQQKIPFLKSICYSIRIEEGKEREEKREKMDTLLQFYLPKNHPKSRLFQIIKRSPNYRDSKNLLATRYLGIAEIWTIRTIYKFLKFQLYGIFNQYSNFVNSKNSLYNNHFRFVYFQEYFIFLQFPHFWNSRHSDHLFINPIFGIPIIPVHSRKSI